MGGLMLTLYDAARCPYCARVRIVLAEKTVESETVEGDLTNRPAWIYEKNSTGRVAVVEEEAWLLP
jgi:glutathione S-transferase